MLLCNTINMNLENIENKKGRKKRPTSFTNKGKRKGVWEQEGKSF